MYTACEVLQEDQVALTEMGVCCIACLSALCTALSRVQQQQLEAWTVLLQLQQQLYQMRQQRPHQRLDLQRHTRQQHTEQQREDSSNSSSSSMISREKTAATAAQQQQQP